MDVLFALLFFLSLLALLVGLIKPTIFIFIPKSWQTRGRTSLLFLISAIVCFSLFGSLTDNSSTKRTSSSPSHKQSKVSNTGRDKYGRTPLMIAAKRGKTKEVKKLLDVGADVNAETEQGITALMYAASEGHTQAVQKLLKAGADVNAKMKKGNVTPLVMAVRATTGHPKVVKELAEAGADVNLEIEEGKGRNKSEWTPLMLAVQVIKTEYDEDKDKIALRIKVIQELLKAGADIEAKNEKGNTPLIHAALIGEPEAVRALVKAGANIEAKSKDGVTAFVWWKGLKNNPHYKEILKLLRPK